MDAGNDRLAAEGSETRRLVASVTEGNGAARDQLFHLLYQELRSQAASYLRKERSDHTLQPTALVNELWIRLARRERLVIGDRAHFIAVASQAMRRILVDHARMKERGKRQPPGERRPLVSEELGMSCTVDPAQLLALEDALVDLRSRSERHALIAEMRLSDGLTMEEIASACKLSLSTVEREWRVARALLNTHLLGDGSRSN